MSLKSITSVLNIIITSVGKKQKIYNFYTGQGENTHDLFRTAYHLFNLQVPYYGNFIEFFVISDKVMNDVYNT